MAIILSVLRLTASDGHYMSVLRLTVSDGHYIVCP